MGKLVDLTNQVFGRLKVTSKAKSGPSGVYWNCLCECGTELVVPACHLKTGHTKSCGCYAIDNNIGVRTTTHGYGSSKIYRNVYCNIMARCHNPKYHRFKDYGGKGIKVCTSWRCNPTRFIIWATLNGYRDDVHLHRKDASKGYSPENCVFVTRISHLRHHKCKHSEELIYV